MRLVTFCFVDIIPNNRKVVFTFFLHSSELQNSTKPLKPPAEVTVNWLATCVFFFCFFRTKHHENHKTLMNRSALKSFVDGAFKNLLWWDIHPQKPAVAMSMSPCLHVSICSTSSKSLSKLHKGPAHVKFGGGGRTLGYSPRKMPWTSLITWYFLGAGRLNWFCKCYWQLDSKPCRFSGWGFMLKKMIARTLDLVSQLHPIGKYMVPSTTTLDPWPPFFSTPRHLIFTAAML